MFGAMPTTQSTLTTTINKLFKEGNWVEILRYVDEEELSVNHVVTEGMNGTLFQKAVASDNIALMEALIARGAEVGSITDNMTDVDHAARDGGIGALEWLRNHGQNLTDQGKEGYTLMHWAVSNVGIASRVNASALIDYAHSVNTPVEAVQDNKFTALMMLIKKELTAETSPLYYKLAKYGADLNALFPDENLDIPAFPDGLPLIFELIKSSKFKQADVLYNLGADLGSEEQREAFIDSLPASSDVEKRKKELMTLRINNYLSLPTIDLDGMVRKSDLFNIENELTPLDNPSTWRHLPAILDALAEQGEVLSLRDVLRENHEGKSWMQRAIECRSVEPLLSHLQAQDQWPDATLFGAGNQLSPLGQAVADCAAIGHFFTASHWKGQHPQALNEFYRGLPTPLQQQVTNLKQLQLEVERAQATSQRHVA